MRRKHHRKTEFVISNTKYNPLTGHFLSLRAGKKQELVENIMNTI